MEVAVSAGTVRMATMSKQMNESNGKRELGHRSTYLPVSAEPVSFEKLHRLLFHSCLAQQAIEMGLEHFF